MDYRKQQAANAKRRAEIVRLHKDGKGKSYTQLAAQFGISPARIGQIIKAERAKAVA
jgi:hypothetical protein